MVIMLLIFIIFTSISTFNVFGPSPSESDSIITYGSNNKYQAGDSTSLNDKTTPGVFSPSGIWNNKKWKRACNMVENLVVVMEDDTVGILGSFRYIDQHDEDQSDLVVVDTSVIPSTESITNLVCGETLAFIQTDSGGKNIGYVLDPEGGSCAYILTVMDIIQNHAPLHGKKVKLIQQSVPRADDTNSFVGFVVVTNDNEVWYIGDNVMGGACCGSSASSFEVFTRCLGSVLDKPVASRKNIITIAPVDNGFFAIVDDGSVLFWGDTKMAGMGDEEYTAIYEAIEMDFSSYDVSGEPSDLVGALVRDIVCLTLDREAYCAAIVEDDKKVLYTWTLSNSPPTNNPLLRNGDKAYNHAIKCDVEEIYDITQIGRIGSSFYYVTEDRKIHGWGSNNHAQINDISTQYYKQPQITGDETLPDHAFPWIPSGYGETVVYLTACDTNYDPATSCSVCLGENRDLNNDCQCKEGYHETGVENDCGEGVDGGGSSLVVSFFYIFLLIIFMIV